MQACRQEFHRRLKVYHAWKAKNRKRTTMDENERAPKSVMEAGNLKYYKKNFNFCDFNSLLLCSASKAPPLVQPKQEITTAQHRYFRIPFMRANAPENSKFLFYFN